MIQGTDRLPDLQMFVEQLERITEERTANFEFSDSEYETSLFEGFLETMLELVTRRVRAAKQPTTHTT